MVLRQAGGAVHDRAEAARIAADPRHVAELQQGDELQGRLLRDAEAVRGPVERRPGLGRGRIDLALDEPVHEGHHGLVPEVIGDRPPPASELLRPQPPVDSDENDVGVRFNRSTHPCGLDGSGLRVTCPLAAGPSPAGEEVVVIVELDALVEDGSTFTYGLAFDDDGDDGDNYQFGAPFDWDYFRNSELWYRLEVGADGDRRMWAETGRPGRVEPRHSSALVIEYDRFLAWIVPRSEVPGDVLVARATAFRNEGDPTALPVPETSAGDVSGEDPSTPLLTIDTTSAAPVELTGAALPDVDAPVARVDAGPDPDQTLYDAMVAEFGARADATFAGGATVDDLLALFHPAVVGNFGTEEQCRTLIERTILLAEGYAVTGPAIIGADGPAAFAVPVEFRYPTGAVPGTDLLLPTGDGRLGWLFDCSATG